MVLETFMKYKQETPYYVLFRMPILDYNQFIEEISINMDNFNAKINQQIENYNKQASNVEKVLEGMVKSAAVDYEVMNGLMQEKFI